MPTLFHQVALGIALTMFPLTALPTGAPQTAKKTTCCFTNPRFTGVCRVEPGKDETCEKILAYLNIPSSSGKDYCGSTAIRGGWKVVPCDETPQKPAKEKRGR